MYNKLIVFLLLFYATNTFGQISFGITGGVNRNDVIVTNAPFLPTSLYRPNTGYHLGVFTRIQLSKFSFNPELLFVQRGCNSSTYLFGSILQPISDTRINLNYIELPLLFTFFSAKWFSIEAGPNASMKLSAKEISDNGKKDVSDWFNKPYDFGINGGIRASLGSKISIVGRYYHGLRSILQFPNISPNTFPSSSSKTFQLSLHYLLRE